MIQIPFFKYQGTGNDFVMLDQRQTQYLHREDQAKIEQICDRRFGIGADGLILLENHPDYDFEMIYFNADGRESSMCGNGGRCTVAFAHRLGVLPKNNEKYHFLAIDGEHFATIRAEKNWVELQMADVSRVEEGKDYYLLNTGSPHFVVFVEDLKDIDVLENGRQIRYSERFRQEGVNVNFVQQTPDTLHVATYERGVEAETYSCGTGVTAAAIANFLKQKENKESPNIFPIQTKGGRLEVRLSHSNHLFHHIWLCGAATSVFEGVISI